MSELSKEARELLASLGEADGPSSAQTSRMKRKLGAALGAASGLLVTSGAASIASGASAAGVVAGAKAGTGLVGLLSMFALGAAAGVGLSSTTALVRHLTPPAASAPVAPVRASAAPARPPVPAQGPVEAASPNDPLPPASVTHEAPSRPPVLVTPPSPLTPSASALVEPTLGPEVELVIAAKRELTQGRAAQSLALVDRLAREFPNGALREERMLLRVLSLCALGQVEPARRQAREFARTAPRSPLLPRLEQSCGGDAVSPPNGPESR
jgi:hypothetical protein